MTNNEVKAPRPCTLWGQTFDSNTFKKIETTDLRKITREHEDAPLVDHGFYFSVEVFHRDTAEYVRGGKTFPKSNPFKLTPVRATYAEAYEDAQKLVMEAIQAITSAQRPWLKAEGFEFCRLEKYLCLTYHTEATKTDLFEEIKRFSKDGNLLTRSLNWSYPHDRPTTERVVAFKPMPHYTATPEQVQLYWDAVAGVKVWEGVV
jgi:hypothetical protein